MKAARKFDGVELTGLLGLGVFVDALVELFADAEARELLETCADADAVLGGDSEPQDKRLAVARDDKAREALGRLLAVRSVCLPQDEAIRLRKALQHVRLGEGRADDWQARRRVA